MVYFNKYKKKWDDRIDAFFLNIFEQPKEMAVRRSLYAASASEYNKDFEAARFRSNKYLFKAFKYYEKFKK